MTGVVLIETQGGPEVMQWRDVEVPPPGPGEARIRSRAIGLNFIDTYHRSGLYPVPLPAVLGVEAAGVVEALGPGVEGLAVGDRVGTFGPELGAYAEVRNVAASRLLPIPDDIDDEIAAAVMLKGGTTEYLVERCACVEPGSSVLVHAAAGGVGLLLVQWLKAIGATVIGTVGSAAKAEIARAAGADHLILYREENVAERVSAITGGARVPVVFDGIGMATWEASLDSLAPRGLLVSYGNAGGAVTGVNLGILSAKGSLFVTRPTLYHYYSDPAERAAGAARIWAMIRSGGLAVTIGQRFALRDVADAHRALEARDTNGSTLLIP